MIYTPQPIYIPSRGRWQPTRAKTARMLRARGLPFTLVVEPQEVEVYAQEFGHDALVVLPERDRGVAFVRTAIKRISIDRGERWHWQLDDNILAFSERDEEGKVISCLPELVLLTMEQHCLQFGNVAIAAPAYACFPPGPDPLGYNKNCCSCVLVANTVPHTWRPDCGPEDTDYSLQALSAGWCTILFRHLLMHKATTGSIPGGNTEFYAAAGREAWMTALTQAWPGVFTVNPKTGKARPSRVWRSFTQRPAATLEAGRVSDLLTSIL